MRRKPKENNFKAVLETIRHLMNTECVVPPWLHDILLGYGDPGAAHYKRMKNQARCLDFNDTFIDEEHLRESFPDHTVKFTKDDSAMLKRPFKIIFENVKESTESDDDDDEDEKKDGDKGDDQTILVEPYITPRRGPYVYNEPKK